MPFNLVTKLAIFFVVSRMEIHQIFGLKRHFVKLHHFIHFFAWKINGKTPPYPHWKEYGTEFTKYAEKRMLRYEKEIPGNLENWFQGNIETLHVNPVDRPRNVALAIRLLPFFERFPEGWGACAFLNDKKSMKKKSFYSYMNDWYESCPNSKQKKFVKKIAAEFGIKLPMQKNMNDN